MAKAAIRGRLLVAPRNQMPSAVVCEDTFSFKPSS